MLLRDHTTMRVGGPAARSVTAATRDELVAAVRDAWAEDEPLLVLGGGSNLVVGDDGFDGTVVLVASRGIRTDERDGIVHVTAEAGEGWDDLVEFTVQNGLAGIEALSGIPGSVGAAPIQNIGAYGQEVGDTLVAIDFLDEEVGEVVRVTRDELGLAYRTSAIKRGRAGVVLSIELALRREPVGPVRYAQLASSLGVALGDTVRLDGVRETVLALRAAKGMLDNGDPDAVSCGSFFTNPIVPETVARRLPADAPRWPMTADEPDLVLPIGAEVPVRPVVAPEDRLVKLSAAWLIEHSGIGRGFALPGSSAAISSKHTLAITNRGDATAEQVAELARFVQARVLAEFAVLLHPEPVLLGVTV